MSAIQEADGKPDDGKTDSELVEDLLPEDKGGRYALIEDPQGDTERIGPSVFGQRVAQRLSRPSGRRRL